MQIQCSMRVRVYQLGFGSSRYPSSKWPGLLLSRGKKMNKVWLAAQQPGPASEKALLLSALHYWLQAHLSTRGPLAWHTCGLPCKACTHSLRTAESHVSCQKAELVCSSLPPSASSVALARRLFSCAGQTIAAHAGRLQNDPPAAGLPVRWAEGFQASVTAPQRACRHLTPAQQAL